MTAALWTAFELLVNAFESGVCMHFVCAFLGADLQKKPDRRNWIALTFLCFLTTTILNAITSYEGILLATYSAVVFLFSLLRLPGSVLKKAFVSVFFLAIVMLVSTLMTGLVSSAAGIPLAEIYTQSGLARFLTVVLVQLTDFYVFQLLLQLFGKGGTLLRWQEWILLSGLFLLSTAAIVLIQLAQLREPIPMSMHTLLLASDVSIVGINLTAVRLIASLGAQHRTQMENARLRLQLENQQQYASSVQQQEHAIHAMRHDFKQSVSVLQTLLAHGNQGEAQAYLEQYEKRLHLEASVLHTDNPSVNAILNTKLTYAKSQGIQCACHCVSHLPSCLDVDFCTLLGNLLDNAIEACLREEQSAPELTLDIVEGTGQLRIRLRNTITQSILARNPTLHTTKPDAKAHGYGIRTVREITARYNGETDFYEEAGCFVAQVILRLRRI